MTEVIAARAEGEPAFPAAGTAEENAAGSQPGTENEQSAENDGKGKGEGEETGADGQPFDKHPRWKKREEEWNQRFNDQEKRHTDAIEKLRTEFAPKPAEPVATAAGGDDEAEIPEWFGGTAAQWAKYNADLEKRIAAARDQAAENAIKRLQEATTAQEKAVAEATNYLESEVIAIQNDKTLNPSGTKVDHNKLAKFVLDNHLVDAQGKWNYRLGWKFMQQVATAKQAPADRRQLAAASASGGDGADAEKVTFKTAKDFRGPNRIW